MNYFSYHQFHQAFQNLFAAKLRSFLAMLGVLVGTAAVVTLLNCGKLATEKALSEFKHLGINLLSLSLYPQNLQHAASENELSLQFWESLPQNINEIQKIAPYGTGFQPIFFKGYPLKGAIIGAEDVLPKLVHIELKEGFFVSRLNGFDRVCVIGNDIAQQIKQITLISPLQQQIKLGQSFFTIIGVLKPWQQNGFFNEDLNQAIIIPLTAMALINKDSHINNAVILISEKVNIDQLTIKLKNKIQTIAPNLNLFLRSAKQIVASMENQGKIFTLLLALIGSISLLVGGIGVMNVMLVSVSERKKEIGLRKAVGANRKDIQLLFLIESIFLSILGGVLGLLLGIVITFLTAYFSHWPFKIYLFPLFIGFGISVLTGIFFGYYPAKKAARLDPIISLRHE